MFKALLLCAVCSFSLSSFAQQATGSQSIADFNKSTGLASIAVMPVYTPFPVQQRSNTLTALQNECVTKTLQGIKEAAIKVYGSVESLERSLKDHDVVYRIELADMTSKATRDVYGEGKMYAHISMGSEETGTIFLRSVITDKIVTYIDPENNKISCAASSAEQVESFLLNKYQPSVQP
jgi:hypothetical protein